MKDIDAYKLATIILVEDNLADIDYLKAILKYENVNFNLWICRDGQEILDFLYKKETLIPIQQPDLILLDLNLPKISGFQILETLQKDPAFKSLPIGILSGSHFKEDIKRSYQQGAKFFMSKPLKINDFLENIRKLKNLRIYTEGDSVMICRL